MRSLIELCLDAISEHIHSFSSLEFVPEELAQGLVDRLIIRGGLSSRLLRFLFEGLNCQISEVNLSVCADQVTNEWLLPVAKQKLIHTLSLKSCDLLKASSLRPLTSLPNLTRLDLSNCLWVNTMALHYVGMMKNLEELSLRFCSRLPEAGLSSLAELKRLRLLNLGTCHQLSERLLDGLQPRFETLRVLFLDCVVQVTDSTLAGLLGEARLLSRLDLASTGITCATLRLLATRVPTLEKLGLSGCARITGADLMETLPRMSSLTALDLSRHAWDASSLSALRALPDLVRLSLEACENVGDEQLCAVLPSLGRLQVLRLSGCQSVTDAALHVISAYCRALQDLDVSFTPHITAEGVVSLSHIGSLTRLDLSDHPALDDHTFLALLRLRHLEELHLRSCHVSEVVERELRTLPSLRKLCVTRDLFFGG